MNLISSLTLRMMELVILLEVVVYAVVGDKEDISLAISFYITLISNTLVRLLSGYYFSARKKTRRMNWNYYSPFVTIIFFGLVYFFLYLFQGNPDRDFWTNLCSVQVIPIPICCLRYSRMDRLFIHRLIISETSIRCSVL